MSKNILERVDGIRKNRVVISQKSAEENFPEINSEPLSYILPACSEKTRSIPNAVIRGALFGVMGKGNRKYEQNVLKATINGITVKFTGQQLDQTDLDVWAECVNHCKGVDLGKNVKFSTHSFLKAIGRKTGKFEYEWLKNTLTRLHSCSIELGDGRIFYMGHLLHEWYRDEKTGENVIALDPKISSFFADGFWTGLSIDQRLQLKGKMLAQWLHAFYSTHKKPLAYKVDTLRLLCGSEATSKEFHRMLKKSLTYLSDVTGWECEIDESRLIHVKKK